MSVSAVPAPAPPVPRPRLAVSSSTTARTPRPGEPGWYEAWQDPSSWECLGPSRRSWADDVIDRWRRGRRAARRAASTPTALPAGRPALRLV